jgi:SAM-dependent methyltransferase
MTVQHDELDALLAEQTAYYRARASEYDQTSAFDADSRAQLLASLEAFAPRGRVLELACGTGEWTVELVRHASPLTAVDASPEMLVLNRERAGRADVCYLNDDGRAFFIDDLPAVALHEQLIADTPAARRRAAIDDRRALPNREGVLRARRARSSIGRPRLGC